MLIVHCSLAAGRQPTYFQELQVFQRAQRWAGAVCQAHKLHHNVWDTALSQCQITDLGQYLSPQLPEFIYLPYSKSQGSLRGKSTLIHHHAQSPECSRPYLPKNRQRLRFREAKQITIMTCRSSFNSSGGCHSSGQGPINLALEVSMRLHKQQCSTCSSAKRSFIKASTPLDCAVQSCTAPHVSRLHRLLKTWPIWRCLA